MVLACQEGHLEIVRLMLETDTKYPLLANLQQPRNGVTPLISALYNHKMEITKLLLEHQADPTILTSNGQSALHLAASNRDAVAVGLLRAAVKDRQSNVCV